MILLTSISFIKIFVLFEKLGRIVAEGNRNRNNEYNGNWSCMDEDFRREMKDVIEHLLKPDYLVIKKINRCHPNGIEFLEYALHYLKIFQSNDLLKPQTIYELMVEKQLSIIVEKYYNQYKELLYSAKDILINISQASLIHEECKKRVLKLYSSEKKIGDIKHHEEFRDILIRKIENLYSEWTNINENNNKRIQNELEKVIKLMEEKQKLLQDQLESERTAKQKLEEILTQRELHTESEIKKMELRYEAEKQRSTIMLEEKISQENFIVQIIKAATELATAIGGVMRTVTATVQVAEQTLSLLPLNTCNIM